MGDCPADARGGSSDDDDIVVAAAHAVLRICESNVFMGVILFFFPEPVTSMVGIALIVLGVIIWLTDWLWGDSAGVEMVSRFDFLDDLPCLLFRCVLTDAFREQDGLDQPIVAVLQVPGTDFGSVRH